MSHLLERARPGPRAAAERARNAVAWSICPVCSSDFRSRIRLVRHLVHGSRRCVAESKAGRLPVLAPCIVAEADAADRARRATRRKAGTHDVAGLPFVRRASVPLGADIFALEDEVSIVEVAVGGVEVAVDFAAVGHV